MYFTGLQRDSESGLDNFGARYNASSFGRFMSADADNISGESNKADPQSWEAYADVRNNHLNDDVKGLIQAATGATETVQAGGNVERVVGAERMIGTDRDTGRSTSVYTVITDG